MAQTAHIQYVCIDIAGSTRNRSVEAQAAVLALLGRSVRAAISEVNIPRENVLLLPAGDGIAVAIVEARVFDAHMQVALGVLRRVAYHNQVTANEQRRFEVRVVINESTDTLVTDVNDQPNVAGDSIFVAQRILEVADGSQVLLAHSAHETLNPREEYAGQFVPFKVVGGHGTEFMAYQYDADGVAGLNTAVPSVFVDKRRNTGKLTLHQAVFVALAQLHTETLRRKDPHGERAHVGVVVLDLLATDFVRNLRTREDGLQLFSAWGATEGRSFDEQYEYYSRSDPGVLGMLGEHFCARHFTALNRCLDHRLFPTDVGLELVKEDWPQIWDRILKPQ